MSQPTFTHDEFEDNLGPLVDGDDDAIARADNLLVDDDDCRDALYEARQAAEAIADAGADFEMPSDMNERLQLALPTDADVGSVSDSTSDSEDEGNSEAATDSSSATEAVSTPPSTPTADEGPGMPWRRLAPWVAAAAAATAIVWGGAHFSSQSGRHEGGTAVAVGATSATLITVDGAGVTVDGQPVQANDAIGAGAVVATDAKTRVQFELNDGSMVTLARGSHVVLGGDRERHVRLDAGKVAVEASHIDGADPLWIAFEGGRVEVLGTRFVVTKSDDGASVRVSRGLVRLVSADGKSAEVNPGQEGLLSGGRIDVGPAADLAYALSWSELGPETEKGAVGLGELRARKPGDKADKERPLTLADHKVSVRVVGNLARTEVVQTFRNDTKHTLEGIYKFPLPTDARIDRLALDVDGGFEEGAFVDADRASKIWAGVIRRATPEQMRIAQEEIIWVPGPWKDPALLQWKKGGNFELRIFPIPKNGQRTIKLSYTQVIAPYGSKRRYVYPMAHSSDGSTAAEAFNVDINVIGADAQTVRAHGYDMDREDTGTAVSLRKRVAGFAPSGDLIVDFAQKDEGRELRYYSFAGAAAAAPGVHAANAKRRSAAPDPKVAERQSAIAADPRPYALFALRPELPGWTEHKVRDIAIVVDSSQSMVGERYSRASKLAAQVVAELDRRDRFTVLACDLGCRRLAGGMTSPSGMAGQSVLTFLGKVAPAGSSNLVAAVSEAGTALAGSDRAKQIIYIGDGSPSVGQRRAAGISAAIDTSLGEQIALSTVGIGGDSDSRILAAAARAGGGQYVPYVPGEKLAVAAVKIISSTYGARLTNAALELPRGFEQVYPSTLSTLRSGEEVLVAARFSGPVKGDAVLRGSIAGEPFERRYPVDVVATDARGNAFVPQVWASAKVAELELAGRVEDRAEIVALSKAYSVMSRHTSLLVLESEAMFSAFGVDRARSQVSWTGEEEAEFGDAGDEVGAGTIGGLAGYGTGGIMSKGGGGMGGVLSGKMNSGKGIGATRSMAARAKPNKKRKADFGDFGGAPSEAAPAADRPAGGWDNDAELERQAEPKPKPTSRRPPPLPERRRGPGRYMKRQWFKTASVGAISGPSDRELAAITAAESALAAAPDNRENHRRLVRALSRAGMLNRAATAAEQWLERDRLDPEALTYLSDILGRQGHSEQSLRLLSGTVDLAPDSVVFHERMSKAFQRAGRLADACAHQLALAEIQRDSGTALGNGVRCLRALGDPGAAVRLLASTEDGKVRGQADKVAAVPAAADKLRGKVRVEALWDADVDLDVSLITPQGTRLSWMGGRRQVFAGHATDHGREVIGLRGAGSGSYVIEVSRQAVEAAKARPIRGTLQIRAYDSKKTIPFELVGDRVVVGRIRVKRESRMIPM